jgi:hypothetical protein
MKLVPPTLLVLLSIVLTAGFSQDKKGGPKPQGEERILQGTGDPPVTLYRGSLNVYSRAGWKDNLPKNPTAVSPLPLNGSLHSTGCPLQGIEMMGDKHATSAYLAWDIDANNHFDSWDIAPPSNGTTKVTITYGANDGTNDTKVTVTVPAKGQITMETKPDAWGGGEADAVRSHQRLANVKSIAIQGAALHPNDTFTPDPNHPKFRLAFCFK